MKKRILAVALAVTITLALCSCGKDKKDNTTDSGDAGAVSTSDASLLEDLSDSSLSTEESEISQANVTIDSQETTVEKALG